jgi:hypothetical protein
MARDTEVAVVPPTQPHLASLPLSEPKRNHEVIDDATCPLGDTRRRRYEAKASADTLPPRRQRPVHYTLARITLGKRFERS